MEQMRLHLLQSKFHDALLVYIDVRFRAVACYAALHIQGGDMNGSEAPLLVWREK